MNTPCRRKIKSINPLRVSLPNGDTMDSTHPALLYIPDPSKAASVSYVFPSMANNSLLSVCQLFNEGYYVTFNIDGVTIFNDESNAIMKGHRGLVT